MSFFIKHYLQLANSLFRDNASVTSSMFHLKQKILFTVFGKKSDRTFLFGVSAETEFGRRRSAKSPPFPMNFFRLSEFFSASRCSVDTDADAEIETELRNRILRSDGSDFFINVLVANLLRMLRLLVSFELNLQ